MSQELVEVKQSGEVAFPQAVDLEGFGFEVDVTAADIIIPKILVMQGLSKLVADEKAMMGEIRESMYGKLLAARGNPLEFIPFYMNRTWAIFKEVDGTFEYVEQVPFTPANADWTWEAVIDGVRYRRDHSYNFFCCLPSEIEKGLFMPYMIPFKRTSAVNGKKLVTTMEVMKMQRKPLVAQTFKLQALKTENDKGTFYLYDVTESRPTTIKELEAIKPWFMMVKKGEVKVDESDLKSDDVIEVSTVGAPAGTVNPQEFANKF